MASLGMDGRDKFTGSADSTTEYDESEDGGGAHVKLQPSPTACKVRVILHRRCRWPEDSTLSERQSWGVELLVSVCSFSSNPCVDSPNVVRGTSDHQNYSSS